MRTERWTGRMRERRGKSLSTSLSFEMVFPRSGRMLRPARQRSTEPRLCSPVHRNRQSSEKSRIRANAKGKASKILGRLTKHICYLVTYQRARPEFDDADQKSTG